MTKDELIEELAVLLTGLQVPLSLGGAQVLGAADEPYRKILADRGWGWADVGDFQKYLAQHL